MTSADGGYLIPPGEPSAESLCEALNREAEPGVYYVTQVAELSGWTLIYRMTRPQEPRCAAVRVYPYLDDWTDKADEWHEDGDMRPTFGTVRQSCLLATGHNGDHRWPGEPC